MFIQLSMFFADFFTYFVYLLLICLFICIGLNNSHITFRYYGYIGNMRP